MENKTDEFSFILKPSSIKGAGIGIFAVHDIAANTKLAINAEGGESRTLNAEEIPEELRHFGIELGNGKLKVPKKFNHLWIGWYLNHSDNPNISLRQDQNNYYSIHIIKAGQELLTDYKKFDEPENLREEYYR